MRDVLSDLPADVSPLYFPLQIRRRFPEVGSIFYFDNWPFVPPILVVASPSSTRQICQERPLRKFSGLRKFFAPIGGPMNLISLEGAAHKKWRGVFNPGFSSSHIVGLAPEMIRETLVFCSNLSKLAESGEIFQLKTLTDNLTMDVIGKIVLDSEFNSQVKRNPLIAALRDQVQWLSIGTELNLWRRWHPVRPFKQRYNTRIMNRYIESELRARFDAYTQGRTDSKRKSVVDMAIQTYLGERNTAAGLSGKTEKMNASFERFVIDQMKLLLFSGHDTTSTALCYTFYFLWANPDVLHRVRAEHEEILGAVEETPDLLLRDPHVLNRLPLTLAVIKEALRLFPLASGARQGEADYSVVGDDGRVYPTEECMVLSSHMAIQRSREFWPEPDKFLPDRWLVSADDESRPIQGAWRPFEFGPRNCIGQELAIVELKMALVFVARRFAFDVAYEEWDQTHVRKGPKTVSGERAYLSIDGGPSDGMPCRIRLLNKDTVR